MLLNGQDGPMDLNDLRTFAQVAECGGISLAAVELGVPKSTISRRVARLERALGVDLLLRGGGPAMLSERGTQLYRAIARPLVELSESGRVFLESAEMPCGTVRLSAPFDLGASCWFAELITAFCREHPLVSFDIVLTGRLVNVFEETFDIALRAHFAPLSDTSLLKVKPLGTMPLGLFASPEYLKRCGRPTKPEELSDHRCIALAHLSTRWLFTRGREQASVAIRPAIKHCDFASVLPLLVAGAGVAPLPAFVAADALRSETLEPVLTEWQLPGGQLSLLWPAQRRPPAKLRAFVDFVCQRGIAGLTPPSR